MTKETKTTKTRKEEKRMKKITVSKLKATLENTLKGRLSQEALKNNLINSLWECELMGKYKFSDSEIVVMEFCNRKENILKTFYIADVDNVITTKVLTMIIRFLDLEKSYEYTARD